MRVFSYIRVSGKGQVDGDGPDRQRDSISKFCEGHTLHQCDEFFEPGVSGTVEGMDRPAFSSMLERLVDLPGVAQAIVVERLDRLARDLMVQELMLAECRKLGIQVFAADQGELHDMASNSCDPTRVLVRQILGALSQWEKTVIVRKLKAARDRVKAETGHCEGKKPFGFYPNEKSILRIVQTLRTESFPEPPMSFDGIAQLLNDGGHTTRSGGPWHKSSVKRISSGKPQNRKKKK